jgi:hypothetical protein
VIVVSAYGERADWMRNIGRNPGVIVTWAGREVPAIAEVVNDAARRQDIVSAHPFVGFLPLAIVRPIAEATLWLARPAVVALLRRFVVDRPVVVIHVTGDGGARGR